ncbi:MAG: hypothetical protein ABIM89_01270 [Mycobacteriales bacterium]
MSTATVTITDHIISTLSTGDYIRLFDRSAPAVLIDMNSPTWRFQAQGRDDIVAHFVDEFAQVPSVRCTQFRVRSAGNPVVVESESRYDGDDGEYLWRTVDIVQTLDNEIVELTQYCSGVWDPATVARQAVEAPMVRW